MKLVKFFLALAVLIAFNTFTPRDANAANQEWRIYNNHPNIIYFKVYSGDSRTVWPADGRAWVLNRSYHTINIACRQGQQICYGAALKNDDQNQTYWGRGTATKSLGCSSCCWWCQHGTHIDLSLNPGPESGGFVHDDTDGEQE